MFDVGDMITPREDALYPIMLFHPTTAPGSKWRVQIDTFRRREDNRHELISSGHIMMYLGTETPVENCDESSAHYVWLPWKDLKAWISFYALDSCRLVAREE